MRLGTCADGAVLEYDGRLYEFRLDGRAVSYADVLELDDLAQIRWAFMEQRDWLRRIDPARLEACKEEARAAREAPGRAGTSPHERVLADAAADDGILAGAIVQADPALVQAVADELASRGLASPTARDASNPLAQMELPRGMEALSQMERARARGRAMTRAERRLMRRILRNDDKWNAKHADDLARPASGQAPPAREGEP